MTKRTLAVNLACVLASLYVITSFHYEQPKNANLPKERKAKLVYKNNYQEEHMDQVKKRNEIYKQILRQQEQQRQAEIAFQQEQQRIQLENNKINIEISFYTNDNQSCGKTDAISSSGKYLDKSYIYCAAPADIPFGTKIVLDSGSTLVVVDRGGAIKYFYKNGTRYMKLDVFIKDASESYLNSKGVVYLKGYIAK